MNIQQDFGHDFGGKTLTAGEPTPETASYQNEVSDWWTTSIIEIQPGVIRVRGYEIQDLIGQISFAEQIWLMLRSELPSPNQKRLFEAALVASVDHGPQAPSIATARMAATCGIGLNNAVASGVNALGSVHGGAGEQALEFYLAISAQIDEGKKLEDAAADAVDARLAEKRPIEGFGHRFHPVDPRAPRLLAMLDQAMTAGGIDGRITAIGRAVEHALSNRKERLIPMNIDGVTACVFGELGFDAGLCRGLFVLSRSVGILAHAVEQSRQGGRIKGPMPPSIPYNFQGTPKRALEANNEQD